MNAHYFAGLFDGEGWFSIKRVLAGTVRTRYPYRYQAYAEIVMREQYLMKSLVEFVGAGSIRKICPKNPKHSNYYHASFSGDALRAFLKKVGPFLCGKNKQYKIALEMSNSKLKTGNRPMPQSRYRMETCLHKQMKMLNKRGVGK